MCIIVVARLLTNIIERPNLVIVARLFTEILERVDCNVYVRCCQVVD